MYMWGKNPHMIKIPNPFSLDLATPKNLLWWRNPGLMLGILMVTQVLSGLILALHHCDYVNHAPISAEHPMDEINNGHIFRFIHSSGASTPFFLISMHIGRSPRYKPPMMAEVWHAGVMIPLVPTMVSLLGYVSPWGQMSFWAATVITNPLYVVPYPGSELLEVAWGGPSAGGPTSSRLSILHYTMPFIISTMSVIHLIFLHLGGSSNPIGVVTASEKIEFYWYFSPKDLYPISVVLAVSAMVLLLPPSSFMDSENLSAVDPMKTPEHIKPEWHLSFAYRISRSVPNKAGGALGPSTSILILFFTPLSISAHSKSVDYSSVSGKASLSTSSVMPTWSGGCLVERPPSNSGMLASIPHSSIII